MKEKRGTIIVYTDGSFKKKQNIIKAGYGIYYPNGELSNVSEKYTNDPTNNRAELYAIYKALTDINEKYKYDKIILYTDSKYCINSLTIDIKNWEVNGWKTANKKDVKNQDLIKPIYQILKKNNGKISFEHVMSHGKICDDVTHNNSIVDKLAQMGCEL